MKILKQTFSQLQLHIHEKLIKTPGDELLQTLHQMYLDTLGVPSYAARSLCDKLLREYKEKLTTCKHANWVIVYNVALTIDVAIRKSQFEEAFKEYALHLRSSIMIMMNDEQEPPQPITKEAVIAGQG